MSVDLVGFVKLVGVGYGLPRLKYVVQAKVLVFVRNDIEVEERGDLMSPDISTVWLEYKPHKGKKFLICQSI